MTNQFFEKPILNFPYEYPRNLTARTVDAYILTEFIVKMKNPEKSMAHVTAIRQQAWYT